MIVVNTEADAQVRMPGLPSGGRGRSGGMAVSAAGGFGFELTGLAALLGGLLRRKRGIVGGPDQRTRKTFEWAGFMRSTRFRRLGWMMVLVCSAGMIGLAGCACFTSAYMSYNVTITGTNSTAGSGPQSITVVLSVGQ